LNISNCRWDFKEPPTSCGGVAELTSSQKLKDVVTREETRVLPRFEKLKKSFIRKRQKYLLVTGPSNEISIAKILAEFGAEVLVVPSMRNGLLPNRSRHC